MLKFDLTLWRPAAFGDFQKKNAGRHMALRENISAPVWVTDSVPSKIFVSQLVSKKCRQDQKNLRRPL